MDTPMLFLSKDRKYLMDENENNVCSVVAVGDIVYYKLIMPESDSIEKVCLSRKTIKVCTQWSATHRCISFGEVEVCTQWQLLQSGHGSIS